MARRGTIARAALLLAAAAATTGCLALAAGAGAGAAVAYTQRGASSVVAGSVEQAFDRSVAAFRALDIAQTGQSTEASGARRKLVGTKRDLQVTVELGRATDSTTNVEVYAQRSPVDWDKMFARDVLTRIVGRD